MPDQSRIAHPKVWTLDKSVPLALILTLAMQGAVGIWWASNQSTRMEAVEKLVAVQAERMLSIQESMQTRSDRTALTLQSISERAARLEVGQEAQRQMIEQIARRLDVGSKSN